MEAQGKRYCITREHFWPIHLNIPSPAQPQPLPQKPKPSITHIPKPNPKHKHTPYHTPLPGPSAKPLSHSLSSKARNAHTPKVNTSPSVKDLLQHLSTTNPLPSDNAHLRNLEYPQHLHQHWPHPVTQEEVVAGSPLTQHNSTMEFNSTHSSWDSTCSAASTASYTLCPRLPLTYNETVLSCLCGRPPG